MNYRREPMKPVQQTHTFPPAWQAFSRSYVFDYFILFSSLHFTESTYKMCFIAPYSQTFRALEGFVIFDRQHPGCAVHENEGRSDVLLPGRTFALELQHTGSTVDHFIRVWVLLMSSQHITDVL